MTKELRALLDNLERMKAETRSLLAQDKNTEAKAKMTEVRDLQSKIDVMCELEEAEERHLPPGRNLDDPTEERDMEELETEYTGIVLRAVRRQDISASQRSVISEYERRAVIV